MLRIIVMLSVFGYCSSNPPTILDYVNHVGPYGYFFRYSTSDGVGREESGELKSPGTPEENYVVQGKTSWTSPEGIPYVVSFISDNNGYRIISPDTYQSYVPSIFFVGPPAIGLLNRPAFSPSTTLKPQQHSVYSTASLQPGNPSVNPLAHLGAQQHSVYSTASLQPGNPSVNPLAHLGAQQHSVYSTASLQPGNPSVNPLAHLGAQQHSVYSTASLQPGNPSVNPLAHLGAQQHSIEHLQSERPAAVNPSSLLEPQQHSTDSLQPGLNSSRPTARPTTSRPSIRPVHPYVPPPNSASFGPEEDRLPAKQESSAGDVQRTAEGVVPAGPPKIGAGTAAALIG